MASCPAVKPEVLLEKIVQEEQTRMKEQLGFMEAFIPSSDAPAKCNIFLSPNWSTCARLLLIIVSGKGIQPGIWSRSLVLVSSSDGKSNYRSGSMLPYLHTALSAGYGVIVMNPNTNVVNINNEKTPIPSSNTPEVHVEYVWEKFVQSAICAQVYIVSYGRGGVLAKHLITTQAQLRSKLAAVAFIESSHRISPDDLEEVRSLVGTRAINWQRSKEPPGTQLPDCAQLGCLSLSAGEPVNEQVGSNTAWTIAASMDTVFAFFESAQASLPMNTSNTSAHDPADDADMIIDNENEQDGHRSRSIVISTSMSVNDFDLLSVVGKGAYGKVFLAKKKEGRNAGRVYAMKVLRKEDVFKKKQVEHTKSEQRILKHVEHPFVVRLRYAFQSDYKLYLVMDYYNGGSLFYHLRKAKQFPEERARFYAAQLLLAIAHLHSMHIMYRDLKLENILMDGEGNIAITDFGLSKEDDEGSTFVGTPEYLAPELLCSQRTASSYGKSVDWWSYGVLVYEMIRGQTPYWDKNRRQMFQNILTGAPYFNEEIFSPQAKDFLQGVLIKNPEKRLGCGSKGPMEIMEHPWFNGIDWNAMLAKEIPTPFKPQVGMNGDTRYVPMMFKQQEVTDSPVTHSLSSSGPGRQTMHFEDFSYMGSDIMGSRRTSLFRESDLRMELDELRSADAMSFEETCME